MDASFTLQFLDLTVYLVPGGTALAVLLLFWKNSGRTLPSGKSGGFLLALAVIASFILGICINTCASTSIGMVDRIVGSRLTGRVVTKLPDFEQAKTLAPGKVKARCDDDIALFRYVETVVEINVPKRAESASRLEAIGLCARNLILVLPFAFIALMKHVQSRRRRVALLGVTLVTATLMGHCYLVNKEGAYYILLRAFNVWASN